MEFLNGIDEFHRLFETFTLFSSQPQLKIKDMNKVKLSESEEQRHIVNKFDKKNPLR